MQMAVIMRFVCKGNPRTAAVTQWLSLLDLNVWVILALMMGVAGFTMVSGLLILILERTSTIGVLKALGATNRCIRHIFIEYAAFILIRGLVWGNIVGLGIVLLQKYFAFVKLDPSTYYVEAAPVEISVCGLLPSIWLRCCLRRSPWSFRATLLQIFAQLRR